MAKVFAAGTGYEAMGSEGTSSERAAGMGYTGIVGMGSEGTAGMGFAGTAGVGYEEMTIGRGMSGLCAPSLAAAHRADSMLQQQVPIGLPSVNIMLGLALIARLLLLSVGILVNRHYGHGLALIFRGLQPPDTLMAPSADGTLAAADS